MRPALLGCGVDDETRCKRYEVWWCSLLLAFCITGCGGEKSVPFEDLATAMTEQRCKSYVRCGFFPNQASCLRTTPPSYILPNRRYGGLTTLQIRDSVFAGTIEYDPLLAGECVAALGSAECTRDAGLLFPEVEACEGMLQGTRLAGEACIETEECENGLECSGSIPGPTCLAGTCGQKRVDRSCNEGECRQGSFCNSGLECVEDYLLEQSCQSRLDCPLGTVCIEGECAPWPDTGEACDGNCLRLSDFCGPDQTCIRCSQTGDSCTQLYSECTPDSKCIDGVCEPLGEPGDACFLYAGFPNCLLGLRCSDSTGLCENAFELPACPRLNL